MRALTREEDEMQRYEYLVISSYRLYGKGKNTVVSSINNEYVREQNIEFYSYLNKLGSDGWEVVAVDSVVFFILKRDLP